MFFIFFVIPGRNTMILSLSYIIVPSTKKETNFMVCRYLTCCFKKKKKSGKGRGQKKQDLILYLQKEEFSRKASFPISELRIS